MSRPSISSSAVVATLTRSSPCRLRAQHPPPSPPPILPSSVASTSSSSHADPASPSCFVLYLDPQADETPSLELVVRLARSPLFSPSRSSSSSSDLLSFPSPLRLNSIPKTSPLPVSRKPPTSSSIRIRDSARRSFEDKLLAGRRNNNISSHLRGFPGASSWRNGNQKKTIRSQEWRRASGEARGRAGR